MEGKAIAKQYTYRCGACNRVIQPKDLDKKCVCGSISLKIQAVDKRKTFTHEERYAQPY